MRRLLALLLASAFAASSAFAAEPACADDVAADTAGAEAVHGEPADDGCGDCGSGCADCACCRAPLAVESRVASSAPIPARARIGCEPLALVGVRAADEPFQPPRA